MEEEEEEEEVSARGKVGEAGTWDGGEREKEETGRGGVWNILFNDILNFENIEYMEPILDMWKSENNF